ncbi:TetR/AcrR family transcriptional regulator [Niallia sp. NCCP-28]|uniref:TetR/AcrR family transcriptional regulator n=1 Tax=Niallia sp. NCCP-28 TaxID=2934712 RepID=UPI0020BDDD79|nr:TetR/AcrR family transcriptional regulator [Niallia sp. NCCP-28]
MNNRKKHVLNKAHELFIEKGFHATSIQEILENSGISKGTFYNYFTSKNELLISIFKSIYSEIEEKRKKLLRGEDKRNIDIFIKQIELLIKTNDQYKIISLFEEILFTNDEELKEFLKLRRIQELHWVHSRLYDICDPESKPYLLDCAIMMTGILHNLFYFSSLENKDKSDIHKVVTYAVNRIISNAKELSISKEQLLDPIVLKKWLPDLANQKYQEKELFQIIDGLKAKISESCMNEKDKDKFLELIDFVWEELHDNDSPRIYLLESAIGTLKGLIKDERCKTLFYELENQFSAYVNQ